MVFIYVRPGMRGVLFCLDGTGRERGVGPFMMRTHQKHHVMSCHVMSCHVMSCHVVSSCHVMSCHVMSCRVAQTRCIGGEGGDRFLGKT